MLLRHYRPFWHTVSAALRGRDGRIWTGVHIGATVGRLSICAEAVAFGRAVLEGDGTIATAVALRHPKPDEELREIAIVAPCGACREMIVDYAPGRARDPARRNEAADPHVAAGPVPALAHLLSRRLQHLIPHICASRRPSLIPHFPDPRVGRQLQPPQGFAPIRRGWRGR